MREFLAGFALATAIVAIALLVKLSILSLGTVVITVSSLIVGAFIGAFVALIIFR